MHIGALVVTLIPTKSESSLGIIFVYGSIVTKFGF